MIAEQINYALHISMQPKQPSSQGSSSIGSTLENGGFCFLFVFPPFYVGVLDCVLFVTPQIITRMNSYLIVFSTTLNIILP